MPSTKQIVTLGIIWHRFLLAIWHKRASESRRKRSTSELCFDLRCDEFSRSSLEIIGSSNLIQTLQAASLIDECNVWTYPVVLGRGKRLFENGARPCALRLVASKVSTTGVVMSTYTSGRRYSA